MPSHVPLRPSEIEQPMSHRLRPLTVWLFQDRKPGHIHQLEGLAKRLAAHADIRTQWIDTTNRRVYGYCQDAEFLRPTPDIIIGAGHATHPSLVYYKRKYRAFTAVLMTPTLPNLLFDAIISPEHDGLKQGGKILNTKGVINTVTPHPELTKNRNLILIGGLSKHYQWKEKELIAQIQSLCQRTPDTLWHLYDSYRTPSTFREQLDDLCIGNLSLHPFAETPSTDLQEALNHCRQCWVTPDSGSMLYEALTAGAQVGVFDLKASGTSRIVKGVAQLVDTRSIIRFADWQPDMTMPRPEKTFWEAERAAIWLLHQYANWQEVAFG